MESILVNIEDIKAVTDLRLQYFDDVYSGIMTGEDRERLRDENLKILSEELGKTLFVAAVYEDGKCVAEGYMTVIRKAANLRFRRGMYGEIYGVFTDENYRCKGYGGMNIRLLIEKGRQLGLSYIELEASPEGAALYIENGFTPVNAEYERMQYEFEKGVVL